MTEYRYRMANFRQRQSVRLAAAAPTTAIAAGSIGCLLEAAAGTAVAAGLGLAAAWASAAASAATWAAITPASATLFGLLGRRTAGVVMLDLLCVVAVAIHHGHGALDQFFHLE